MWTLVANALGWSWIIWVIVLVVIIGAIYIFIGGKNYRYVGLAPLAAPVADDDISADPVSYIDPFTRERMITREPIRSSRRTQYKNNEVTSNSVNSHTMSIPNSIQQEVNYGGGNNLLYTFSPAIVPGVAAPVAGCILQADAPQTPGRRFDVGLTESVNAPTRTVEENMSDYQSNYIPSPLTLRTPRNCNPIYVESSTITASDVAYNNHKSTRKISLTYTQMAEKDKTICTGITLPENYNIDFREMTEQDDSKGEFVCRCVLSQIYGVNFDKVRPNFLRRQDSGRNLELDGAALNLQRRFVLNDEIIEYKGIAFEFSGKQHYVWPNFTHQPLEAFKRQVSNDKWKLDMCDREGYYVITIPYTVTEQTKSYELIPAWIEYYLLESVIAREQGRLRGEDIVTKPPAALPKVIINK